MFNGSGKDYLGAFAIVAAISLVILWGFDNSISERAFYRVCVDQERSFDVCAAIWDARGKGN